MQLRLQYNPFLLIFALIDGIDYVTDIVRNDVTVCTNHGSPIPLRVQVLAALRYLGSASLQLTVADSLGLSQPTVSRCVQRVCSSLYNKMDQFIKWPVSTVAAKNEFFAISGFPGVVGAIDGTHVRIQEPKLNPNSFINRKYFPSINVCAVCDASQRFTFGSIKWPGSCHDSFILRQTQLWDLFEANTLSGIVLGDNGYPCRNWLLTPYLEPATPAQEAYKSS